MTTGEAFRRPSTSADVARRADVSRSTVSNILNGRRTSRFPESTRQRVLAAAEELDYHPSVAGRSLVRGHSDTIVVLLPHTTWGSNLQDAVDEFMAGTGPIGGNVVVRFAGGTPDQTISAIIALRPLGLVDLGVLSAVDRQHLESLGISCVPSRRDESTDSSDGGIAEVQADALLQNGSRQLWFAALSDKRLDPYGSFRYEALLEQCARRGISPARRVSVPLTLTGAVAALTEITAQSGPAGIACYNDDVGLAILAAARESHIDVPADISVVGVDHTAVGQLWSPALTTVNVDLTGMVAAIAIDLRARLEGHVRPGDGTGGHYMTLVGGETI